MKPCWTCRRELPLSEFFRNCRTKDGHLNHCKRCFSDKHSVGRSERAKRDRAYFQAVKVERGCTDCGYRTHAVALDFDHLPGAMKLYRIACMAGLRRELIDAEIAKCEVVCSNCHRVRTHDRLGE